MKYLSILTVALMVLLAGTAKKVYIPDGIVRSEPTELEKFLDHMAHRESDNTPHVVNRFGMMGKYQFDPRTVKVLGFKVRGSASSFPAVPTAASLCPTLVCKASTSPG